MTLPDGARYEGMFDGDLRQGKGTQVLARLRARAHARPSARPLSESTLPGMMISATSPARAR
jgi:hypothetical protein